MKVGIITLHFGFNFGGFLQCHALQEAIRGMGHEVYVINYNPNPVREYCWLKGWGIRGGRIDLSAIRKRFLELKHGPHACRRFEALRQRKLNLTSLATNTNELAKLIGSFDALVTGSDQVWNFNYHVDPSYFLRFDRSFEGRRISYAACCGCPHERNESWIQDALNGIDHLSVRNQVTAEWVEQASGRDATIVADPTFLHDFQEANQWKPTINGPYVFVYYLSGEIEGGYQRALDEIRRQMGRDLKVVCGVATGHKMKAPQWADQVLYRLDPFEWLAWIRNADLVFTDSFHAALFSAKAGVPFLAYYEEAQRSHRLVDICSRLGLSGRVVERVDESFVEALHAPISWGDLDELFRRSARKSHSFLHGALS